MSRCFRASLLVRECAPGDTVQAAQGDAPEREGSPLQALLMVARSAVPENVVAAAVNMDILGVITFSLFFGLCLAGLPGSQADGLIRLTNVSTPRSSALLRKRAGHLLRYDDTCTLPWRLCHRVHLLQRASRADEKRLCRC